MSQTVEERRRNAKRTATLRARGIYADIPNGPAVKHLLWLHDQKGMTIEHIAAAGGIPTGTVHAHMRGMRTKLRRDTFAAIMAIQPEGELKRGGYVDSLPTRRRLGALGASGFPLTWLTAELGLSHNSLMRIYRAQRYVYTSTARVIEEAYVKYADKNPQDYGITKNASGVTRFYAQRHGHAPFTCWDEDTIADPDAIPEWTGKCGTEQGYRLHNDHNIPMCDPCRDARAEARAERRVRSDA